MVIIAKGKKKSVRVLKSENLHGREELFFSSLYTKNRTPTGIKNRIPAWLSEFFFRIPYCALKPGKCILSEEVDTLFLKQYHKIVDDIKGRKMTESGMRKKAQKCVTCFNVSKISS